MLSSIIGKEESEEEKEEVLEEIPFKKRQSSNPQFLELSKFLRKERKIVSLSEDRIKETKVSLNYLNKTGDHNLDLIKREFIIKTCKINMDENSVQDTTNFMHIFIETTQISQLEEAKAQNKYQKQMLANVSHEFRTPLNAMMMSLVLLKDKVQQPDKKFIKIATSSCNILSSLVEDILDHAKIQAGMFKIQNSVFEMSELFEEIKEMFEIQITKKNIEFNIELDPRLNGTKVKSDKQRVKQIMMNLLSNSLK